MNEMHALTNPAAATTTNTQKGYRSGVHAKTRRDGGGWGIVLLSLTEPATRVVPLNDGAVVGAAARDARVEAAGVAPEHARVFVRADGCYIEDLDTESGTFVDGVRAKRINLSHGDVVRFGAQLAVFVERDLAIYGGETTLTGDLVHGPKQARDWIDPVLELARGGSCVCIEGTPGIGKRSLAKLAGAVREGAGDLVTIDGRSDAKVTIPSGVRPSTWVVLDADRLPRQVQLDIAHAVGRATGVSVIATVSQPLDRAAGDGKIAPWFASLFSGKRVTIPSLDARREDLPAIIRSIAERRGIALDRFTPTFVEGLVRAGWPGGVPQLEATVAAAAEATREGPLQLDTIASSLSRPARVKPALPPATDPSLARARLEDALARANGSVASAARSLGMSRQAIYREAERLGLDIARRKTK